MNNNWLYVNEVTFGNQLRMGAGCQGNQPGKGVELSVSSPDFQGGERA